MKDVKECFPSQLTDYAQSSGIINQPAFAWWCNHVIKKRERGLYQRSSPNIGQGHISLESGFPKQSKKPAKLMMKTETHFGGTLSVKK